MSNEIYCKNCANRFEGKYCNQCGQSAHTERLNFHFFIHEIEHGVFHFNHSILSTLKMLFTRPGAFIRDYLAGKRVAFTSPITTVILIATVFALFNHFLGSHSTNHTTEHDDTVASIIRGWIDHHYVWFSLLTIPVYSIGTWVAFRNQGYNYVEYMALNCYKGAQRLFVHLFTLPLVILLEHSNNFHILIAILYFIDIILIYWTNFLFFDKLSKIKVLMLSIVGHIIFLVLLFLIVTALYPLLEKH